MRKEAKLKFVATLTRHRDSNAYCNMFGRLWGVFDPLDESWCDYYLEWLNLLIEARGMKDETVIPVKNGMAFMVRCVPAPFVCSCCCGCLEQSACNEPCMTGSRGLARADLAESPSGPREGELWRSC